MASAGFGGRRWLIATAVVVAAAMAGCGKPAYHYVTNSNDGAYFKVPSGWYEADVTPVDEFFMSRLFDVEPGSAAAVRVKDFMWSTGYDASDGPTGYHMLTSYPTSEPIVYSMVLHVPPSVQGLVSLDYLRNVFWPVTTNVRAMYEQAGQSLPGFELLRDEVLEPEDGIRGVRVVYNYRLPSDVVHTVDLTAHTNNDSSIIYLLLIRCTADCYQERTAELDEIATSFTVRSKQ